MRIEGSLLAQRKQQIQGGACVHKREGVRACAWGRVPAPRVCGIFTQASKLALGSLIQKPSKGVEWLQSQRRMDLDSPTLALKRA